MIFCRECPECQNARSVLEAYAERRRSEERRQAQTDEEIYFRSQIHNAPAAFYSAPEPSHHDSPDHPTPCNPSYSDSSHSDSGSSCDSSPYDSGSCDSGSFDSGSCSND